MARYQCSVCNYIFDEESEGKKWGDLPEDWVCPVCGADKSAFNKLDETIPQPQESPEDSKKKKNKFREKGANNKMICSVCGYIVKEGFQGEVCPACGVPSTAFKPHVDKMSVKRRKVLDMHLHNMAIHFPQAISLLILFFIFLSIFIRGSLQLQFLITSEILSIFLPLSVLASIFSGIIDGKNRFKRIDTPLLKRKISIAILFLLLSIAVFIIFRSPGLSMQALLWLVLILTGICSLCSLFLGYIGGGLSRSEVPG